MQKFRITLYLLSLVSSLTLIPPPLQAAPSELKLREQLIQEPQNAELRLQLASQLLMQLRKDWGQRDTQITGSTFIEQSERFQRRAQEIVSIYQEVLKLQPKSVIARVNLAEVNFIFLNRFEHAEQLLLEALKTDPDSSQANIAMAEFQFFFKQDRKTALQNLEQIINKTPGQADLSITYADLLTASSTQLADFEKAHRIIADSLKANPNHTGLMYITASVLAREAQLNPAALDRTKAQEALSAFINLIQRSPDTDYLLEAADIARMLGQWEQARQLLRQAQNSGDPRVKLQIGDLLLQQSAASLDAGEYTSQIVEAEAIYEEILASKEDRQLITGQRVQLYYNLGLLNFVKAGSLAGAQSTQALKTSEAYYRQAILIFDRMNMINGPLQQDLARTLVAQANLLTAPNQQSDLYREACQFKLESACQWLKDKGQGP